MVCLSPALADVSDNEALSAILDMLTKCKKMAIQRLLSDPYHRHSQYAKCKDLMFDVITTITLLTRLADAFSLPLGHFKKAIMSLMNKQRILLT